MPEGVAMGASKVFNSSGWRIRDAGAKADWMRRSRPPAIDACAAAVLLQSGPCVDKSDSAAGTTAERRTVVVRSAAMWKNSSAAVI